MPRQYLIAAMPLEAKPLIAHYRLKKITDAPAFEIYQRGDLWLTITGIGKVAAAAAVAFTYSYSGAPAFSSWLNVGIAGHGHCELGDVFAAHKITDMDTQHSHYPPIVIDLPCPTDEVFTVPKVVTDYPQHGLFEMEAAGFYYAATRFTHSELVQCLKVVSDTHHHPVEGITPAWISQAITDRIPFVDHILQQQKMMVAELNKAHTQPIDLLALSEKWHFTNQQKKQLQQLLQRWSLIGGEKLSIETQLLSCRSSRECLQQLKTYVDNYPVTLG